MDNIQTLSEHIIEVHQYFKRFAIKQISNALTFRNWMVGYYIVIYEQEGKDRATYGGKTLKTLSGSLTQHGLKGFFDRNLRLCRQFYLEYPKIGQLMTARFQAIKNNWTVDVLKRNINSMFYERVGLSSDKKSMLAKLKNESIQKTPDIIKSPYLLEFLGIEEKAEYSETDLEQAIINHLQHFLIEMGRGFCFEARQKRITFNNRHYRIDLVFYHRILKCHVLIDLKLGEFNHADSGQMNLYLNYYMENELNEGDNPPVGIILCSQKDEALVHYATGNLPQEVFVSRYLLQLPSEKELKQIINEEIRNYEVATIGEYC